MYYCLTLEQPIVAIETERLYIPIKDEEFIRSLPADVWQRAQRGDFDAMREVFSLASDAGYESDWIDREMLDYVDEANPYYNDRTATFEETN